MRDNNLSYSQLVLLKPDTYKNSRPQTPIRGRNSVDFNALELSGKNFFQEKRSSQTVGWNLNNYQQKSDLKHQNSKDKNNESFDVKVVMNNYVSNGKKNQRNYHQKQNSDILNYAKHTPLNYSNKINQNEVGRSSYQREQINQHKTYQAPSSLLQSPSLANKDIQLRNEDRKSLIQGSFYEQLTQTAQHSASRANSNNRKNQSSLNLAFQQSNTDSYQQVNKSRGQMNQLSKDRTSTMSNILNHELKPQNNQKPKEKEQISKAQLEQIVRRIYQGKSTQQPQDPSLISTMTGDPFLEAHRQRSALREYKAQQVQEQATKRANNHEQKTLFQRKRKSSLVPKSQFFELQIKQQIAAIAWIRAKCEKTSKGSESSLKEKRYMWQQQEAEIKAHRQQPPRHYDQYPRTVASTRSSKVNLTQQNSPRSLANFDQSQYSPTVGHSEAKTAFTTPNAKENINFYLVKNPKKSSNGRNQQMFPSSKKAPKPMKPNIPKQQSQLQK